MSAADLEELPEGWVLASLGELLSPSSEKVEPDEKPDAPYLSLEHIEPHTNQIIGRGKGSDVNSTKAVFQAGDVLYGKLRPYLNKVAIPDFDGICSTDILVFQRRPWIDSPYLMHLLSRREVVEFANHNSAGVQLPRISFKVLGTLVVPFPPLAEQRRIVAAAERMLGRVGAARDRLNRVPATLKRFRQAVLAAACSGRLTADWRGKQKHCADEWKVHRSVASHFQGALRSKNKTGKTLTVDGDGEFTPPVDLPDLPAGWTWIPLGRLGEDPLNTVQTGPFGAQLHNDEFVSSGVPVVAVGNLTGIGFTSDGLYYITPEKAKSLARYDVQAGDLLFARSGATLGKVCVAPDFVSDWRMTGHILRARLERSIILPQMAAFALWGASAVTDQVFESIRGITRPGFNTALLEGIWLPIPPLPEQREIVRRVGELLGLADAVEAKLAAARRRADALTQAVLAKAFRGELVPTEAELARREGRDYEPASALLERIRAEHAKNPASKPRGRPQS
jgi:type I restriction enzyme, S subunit